MSSEHVAVIAGAGGGGLLFILLSCAVLFSSYNRKPNKARIAHDSHDTVAPGHTPNSDTPQNVPSNESIEVLDAFMSADRTSKGSWKLTEIILMLQSASAHVIWLRRLQPDCLSGIAPACGDRVSPVRRLQA